MKRIISFSLYNDRRKDVVNAVINCLLAPAVYPGWTCRFYLDDTVPQATIAALESFDQVELCWMPRHTSSAAMLWRFLAAGDPDVDAVIFRDADSWLSAREVACVNAWLSAGQNFHLIRDHCYHSQAMMGGMWGVRGGVVPNVAAWIEEYEGTGGTYDQGFLADWIYPLTIGRATVHRGEQRDNTGAPTDYMRDGAVAIPDYDEIDEAAAGISWLEAHRLNAHRCSHCGEVHPSYIGPIFEEIPSSALELVERLGAEPDIGSRTQRSGARTVVAGDFDGGCGFDVLCLGGEAPTRRLARRLADTEHRVFLLAIESDPSASALELSEGCYEVQLPVDDPAVPAAQIAALTELCAQASIDQACMLFDAATVGASSALALARQLGFKLVQVGAGEEAGADLELAGGEEDDAWLTLHERWIPWHAKVAIVIVSFDNREQLAATLESLFRNTPYPNFEVVVVDNGSAPDLLAYLEGYMTGESRLRVVRNDANLGFARACNIGIAACADAERVVLLNDDVILTPGWLAGLLRHLGDESVGLVGPVTNNARGESRIEVLYTDLRDLDGFALAQAREHRGQTLEVGMLAMFCVASRAEVLARVGDLDERFTIGMYEDDDYALRLRRAGYRLLCARDVYVHHWGGVSFRRLDPGIHDEVHSTHRAAFEEKWGAPPEDPALLADAAAGVREGGMDPRTPSFAAHLARRFEAHVPIAGPGDNLRSLLASAPAVVLQGGDPQLLRRLIRAAGGSDAFIGGALAVALAQPLERRAPPDFRVQAYVPAFNEADILAATVGHLLAQGVEVHLLENHSTDGTWELCQRLCGDPRVVAERYGSERHYDWRTILRRVEDLAAGSDADWLMLLDADELRVAPWPDRTLRDALWAVECAGFNAVDHTVLNFPPTDDDFQPGIDPRAHFRHVEMWAGPGFAPQIKAWKSGPWRAQLAHSGGHEAEFAQRRVFPFNFIDEHYPLRSQRHAEQKVFADRVPRWNEDERRDGWHAQYDGLRPGHRFLRSARELERYDRARYVQDHLLECLARIGVGEESAPHARHGGRRAAEVSIVYVTHRGEPRFEWFADALGAQLNGEDIEVIVVDGLHSAERGERFVRAVDGHFPLRHVPAKPTPYNGPHRRTRREYFAPANARNSGIVHAQRPYIVFVDDLSLPASGWWEAAAQAAREGYVVAGAYQKHRQMVVRRGILNSSRLDTSGLDSRWQLGSEERRVAVGGGALFGCSLGAPRELLLQLNGFDELCDAIAGEDGQLGYRLEHAEVPIYYDRRMLTIESVEDHTQEPVLARLNQVAHPAVYMARLREFGVQERCRPGGWDNEHMIFDLVHGQRATASIGNHADLRALDPGALEATTATFPRHHWFDQQPLDEL
ncbi:MAG TPA: glycosyltransferase [Solirubrobacteraceae bacterium]|jgi:GT2 family glycosyltransferase